MEFQELTTFIAVAEHNSFSRASKHLGYSPAAVSIQIQHLEKELQVRLFDRLGKKISLTSHGRVFYEHANQLLNDLLKARESVMEKDVLTGALRIGTIDSLCSCVLPKILKEYHRRYPMVSVSVNTNTPTVLLEMLNNNEIDVVYLLDEPLHDVRWSKVLHVSEDAVFAASSRHPLVLNNDSPSPAQLFSCPFILTEKDASYRRVLDYVLKLHNVEIVPFFESNNTDLILDMVRSNMGITFLPEYTLTEDLEAQTLVKIPVDAFHVNMWRQVLHHKDKWVNREMKVFFSLLLEMEGTVSSF